MRVLVAIDGSEPSRRALEFGLELAADAGASVTLVHSVDPSIYPGGGTRPVRDLADAQQRLVIEGIEDAEERGERVLENAARTARERGLEVETELLYGDPERTIPPFADQEAFDLLVVGHRGLSERAERVLGSVAKALVEHSPVPVTVVR